MATDYSFTRTAQSPGYDINHSSRTEVLAKDIEAALPGKLFKVICNDTSAIARFDNALTGAEETTLNNTVSDHQNNV